MSNDITLIDKGFSVAGFNAIIYYKRTGVEYQVFFPNGYGAAVSPGARVRLVGIVHGTGWWEYVSLHGSGSRTIESPMFAAKNPDAWEPYWIDTPEQLSESLRLIASLPPFERNQLENASGN